jgi:hypothetical protein
MSTPLDIINRALKKAGVLGVGQTAQAEDVNDAFDDMNDMIAGWNLRRWIVYNLVDTFITSTGAMSYSVGPGQAFNIPRPDRIEAAFVRQYVGVQGTDYPLRLIEAHEDYNRITLKSLSTLPSHVFYDSGFPTGTLYFYPVPTASIYELHITTKNVLSKFTSLTQAIILPPEYNDALLYNLAVRLRISYQLGADQSIDRLAKASLNTIKNANTQMPLLRMPPALGGRGSRYSIYSDSTQP